MKLSQTTDCARGLGDVRAIELLAQAGYDAVDYSMIGLREPSHVLNGDDYRSYAALLLETAKKHGVVFNQAHGVCGAAGGTYAEKREVSILRNRRAIKVASLLGIDLLVLHPFTPPDYVGHEEAVFHFNMEYFRSLLPYAAEAGVRLACENMWCYDDRRCVTRGGACGDPYEHARYVDAMASEWFTACLDLGHCSLAGRQAQDSIRILGGRLQALHVHDNDYKDDMHTLPGLSEMDWDAITKALADVGYGGDFTLETDHFFDSLREDEAELRAGLTLSVLIGRKMIRKIERFRG